MKTSSDIVLKITGAHSSIRDDLRSKYYQLMRYIFLAIFLLVACSLPSQAQHESVRKVGFSQPLDFERLSLENGLSQVSIYDIYQDRQGFIWFCTGDGLNRYDGYTFKVYRHDEQDSSSLPFNFVTCILEDRSGNFWIGTSRNGLARFDPRTEKFTSIQPNSPEKKKLSVSTIWSLLEDKNGMLWIGSSNGLFNFDAARNLLKNFTHDPKDTSTLDNSSVFGLYDDGYDRLWISTYNGLNHFDKTSHRVERYNLPNRKVPVNWLTGDLSGNLWIGSSNGFYKFNPLDKQFEHYYQGTAVTFISVLSNEIWIGTTKGLDKWDKHKGVLEHYENDLKNQNSLSDNTIRVIFKDRSGVLFVGTQVGGINKLRQKKFRHYLPTSNRNLIVWSMHHDERGTTWLGSNEGLIKCDIQTDEFSVFKTNPNNPNSLSNNNVRIVYEDRMGSLWVGTNVGLDRLENGIFKKYSHNPNNPHSISSNLIFSICEDSADVMWIGTTNGLNKFDRKKEHFSNYKNNPADSLSLSNNTVLKVYTDKAGTVWVGTSTGLDRFNRDGTFTPLKETHFRGKPVRTILEDQDGILWIGTTNGLSGYDKKEKKVVHFSENDGLPNNNIFAILEDARGYLWISTNKGIAKFDKKTNHFRNYDVHDGLQSNEFSVASYKNRKGEMFFGGVNGFNFFHPDDIKDNPYIPPIVLTSFKKNNREFHLPQTISVTDHIDMRYSDNVFSFEFSALSYAMSHKNKYAYRLEGFDEDWVYAGSKRDVTYTNLDPGSYVFRVLGSNGDGVWNNEGVYVKIQIAPPWWKTWWFVTLSTIAMLTIVYLAVTYRLRHLLELERMKTKIAADLHDNIGTGLTEISILSEVGIQTKNQSTDFNRDMFMKIGEVARGLSQNMSDVVWLINPKQGSLSSILLQLRKSYEEIFIHRNIEFRFPSSQAYDRVEFTVEQKKHIYYLFKEAINNSLKYSRCSQIQIDVKLVESELEMVYVDNGVGFDTTDQRGGNGLKNYEERARMLNGRMQLYSAKGEGVRITINIPISAKKGWFI